MKLNNDQKFQVLMVQLQERYTAWHNMRERSTKFTLWILGMAIALSWNLLKEPSMSLSQKVAITLLVLSLGAVSWYFLWAINRGCNSNRKSLLNVETALECYNPNEFLNGKALLHSEHKSTKSGLSNHFKTLYALLLITLLYLISAIWVPIENHQKVNHPDKSNSVVNTPIVENSKMMEIKK